MRTTTSMLLVVAAVLISWQDPHNPAGSQDPKPTAEPPAPQPAKNKTDTDGGVVGKPKAHPFEGVYRLSRRVIDGNTDGNPHVGYLAITREHLFLNLAAPGTDPDYPLLHAGVREWREGKGLVRTVVKLDYYTDAGGDIHTLAVGTEEMRRIEAMRGGLRIVQGDQTWLEFERIE